MNNYIPTVPASLSQGFSTSFIVWLYFKTDFCGLAPISDCTDRFPFHLKCGDIPVATTIAKVEK